MNINFEIRNKLATSVSLDIMYLHDVSTHVTLLK